MATRIQFRRGTALHWSTSNPVLAEGELGFETDTYKFKIGNGILNWNNLPYSNNATRLRELIDTQVSANPTDGSLLIYETNINKWTASTDLVKQNIDAGEF